MLLCSWGPLEFPWSPNSMPTKICLFNLWRLSSWSLLDQSFPTFSTSWQAQKVLSVLALVEERVSISAHQLGKFGSDFWSHTDLQNAALCFHNSILLGAKGSIYRIRWLGTSDCNHTAQEPFFIWVAGGVPLVHSLEMTPTGRPKGGRAGAGARLQLSLWEGLGAWDGDHVSFFLAEPRSICDLNSSTRIWTHAPKHEVLTTGPPAKSLDHVSSPSA